jgi:hypothetical protein
VQTTVVRPTGKLSPEAGIDVTVGTPQLSLAVGTGHVTGVAQPDVIAIEMLAGHVITGGIFSVKDDEQQRFPPVKLAPPMTVKLPNVSPINTDEVQLELIDALIKPLTLITRLGPANFPLGGGPAMANDAPAATTLLNMIPD